MLHTEEKFLKSDLKLVSFWEFDNGIDKSTNAAQDNSLLEL